MQPLSPLHEAALRYAADGIPVFPCGVDDKRPLPGSHGFNDATLDVEQINRWWQQNPNYNVAISPDPAGMFVVDIDAHKGGEEAWKAFCLEHDLSAIQTYEVMTPRGGRHLYFTGHGPSRVDKLCEGVDTRGKGGFVLVPPSVVDGKPYKELTSFDLAALPAAIAERIRPAVEPLAGRNSALDDPANIRRARTFIVGLVQRGDVAIEFRGGNSRTFGVACFIRDLGISQQLCTSLLAELYNPACQPPWDETELATIISHAYEYGQNGPGAYAVVPAAETFKHAAPTLVAPKNRFLTVSQMSTLPDPTWLVPDLLMDRSTALYVGAWASYKSFIALDIALAIAAGKATALGPVPARSGPTIYSAREGMAGIAKARRRAWCMGHDLEPDAQLPFFLGPSPMVADDGDCQAFLTDAKAICAGQQPQLIVIDTLSRSMAGLDETKDAGRFLMLAQGLSDEFGCCVLVLHHFGHDRSKNARGGTIYPANFDTYLEGEAVGGLRVEIRVLKQKEFEQRKEPFTAQGFKVGPSLVFRPSKREDHLRAVAATDPFAKEVVGGALTRLNAIGPEEAVASSVLAQELFPRHADENLETYGQRINSVVKLLTRHSHNKLVAYCQPSATGPRWHLPPW